jgi:hypothetical protein
VTEPAAIAFLDRVGADHIFPNLEIAVTWASTAVGNLGRYPLTTQRNPMWLVVVSIASA